MSKRIVTFLMAICIMLFPLTYVFGASGDTIVHITKTGSKYHRAGCQYLKSSDREVPLEDAVNCGYEPCLKCKPPVLTEEKNQLPAGESVVPKSTTKNDAGQTVSIKDTSKDTANNSAGSTANGNKTASMNDAPGLDSGELLGAAVLVGGGYLLGKRKK